jgi:predicted DNA-binding protein (MmcQ/YjbR family)
MNYESLCNYCDGKPGSYRDMPFGADTLVYKVLNKMFVLIAWQEEPLKISLKADPVDAVILRKQFASVKPGYHMNKKHWITVTLDGCVPDEELRKMITESYTLVVQGLPHAAQAQLKEIGYKDNGKKT